jgi:hypothetical protein
MNEHKNNLTEYIMVVGTDEVFMQQNTFECLIDRLGEPYKTQIERTGDLSFCIRSEKSAIIEEIIEKLLDYCEQENRKFTEGERYCIFISADCGLQNETRHILTANNLLDVLRTEAKRKIEQNQDVSPMVLITAAIFDQLDWRQQYLYSPSIERGTIKVHRRFNSSLLRCFVISPIGREESEIHDRANYVFDTYIKTACDGTDYRPVRGDAMTGTNVFDEIVLALQTDPMVIAYLGKPEPEWNPNVMLEVGARILSNLPIVFLRDSPKEGEDEKPLPFDLLNQRVVYVPCESLDRDAEDEGGIIATKIRTIREMIKEAGEAEAWQYPYGCATMVIERDGNNHRFIETSKELENLFEMKNIIGAKFDQIIKHLADKMPDFQRQPFMAEQERLIAAITSPTLYEHSEIKDVSASVPIVFAKHQSFSGKAFLPVIVRYRLTKEILKVTVLYMDVSPICEKSNMGYFVCEFGKKRTVLLKL